MPSRNTRTEKRDLRQSEETLVDGAHFGLDGARWAAFIAALDAPLRKLLRVRRLTDLA